MTHSSKPNVFITRLASAYYGAEMYLVRNFKLMAEDLGHITLVTNQDDLRREFKASIKKAKILRLEWGREITGVKSLIFFYVTYPFFFILWGILLFIDLVKNRTNVVFLTSLNEKLIVPFWAKAFGMKVIFVEHGIYMNFWKRPLVKIPLTIIDHFVDTVICVSNSVEESFRKEELFKEKTLVIQNGVDLSDFDEKLSKYTHESARRKLGVNMEDFVIGYVGRLEENKGTQFIVRAVAKIIKDCPKIKIVYVGDGLGMASLKKEAKDLGLSKSTTFLGRTVSPPMYLFKTADLWVQPSLFEGISYVALEAAASSKAIIASKVGGLKNIFQHNENGVLFNPGDVDKLAEEIRALYNDKQLQNRLGASARMTIEKQYNLMTGAKNTLELIQK